MKKILSVVLIIALVFSLAGVLGACGKKEKEKDVETTVTEESTTETKALSPFEQMMEEFNDEDFTYEERTTDEHYAEEYEALTLPTGAIGSITTKPAKEATATTAAQATNPARETTTKFMFTAPAAVSQKATTTKAATTKPAATKPGEAAKTTTSPKTTTAPAMSTEATSMTDPIPDHNVAFNGNVGTPTEVPRPQVTYRDRYVTDIIASGTFSASMEIRADGVTIPMNFYVKGDDLAVTGNLMKILGAMGDVDLGALSKLNLDKVSFIVLGSKKPVEQYFVWPGSYTKHVMTEEEQEGDMEFMVSDMISMLTKFGDQGMKYAGMISGPGYVCETYMSEDGDVAESYYFTGNGIARVETIDVATKTVISTVELTLVRGITDKNAFKVSGKQVSEEEVGNLFGDMFG